VKALVQPPEENPRSEHNSHDHQKGYLMGCHKHL